MCSVRWGTSMGLSRFLGGMEGSKRDHKLKNYEEPRRAFSYKSTLPTNSGSPCILGSALYGGLGGLAELAAGGLDLDLALVALG